MSAAVSAAARHFARYFAIGAALVLAVLPAPAQAESPAPTARQLVSADRVLVIAHRGDSHAAPENTLPAFESAVRAGSDLVELDYVHTADGVPLVIHDHTLDRTTDAVSLWGGKSLNVADRTLAELTPLDAGRWFSEDFTGTRLPTLEAALECIQNGSTTLIERKAGDAATCIRLLREKQLLDRVVVQAFDWDFLVDCHRLEPNLVLGALGGGPINDETLDKIADTGAAVVGWRADTWDAQAIRAVHQRGWQAWAWTVDNVALAQKLLAAEIDGLITNKPAVMRQCVADAALPAAN